MKLLVAIASTLLVVLVSQQFASALPLDGLNGFTTEEPMAEHGMDRRTTLFPLTERDLSDFFGTTVVPLTAHIKRELEEPLVDETTTPKLEESAEETEKEKRAKTVKVIGKEEPKEIKETTEETPKKVKVTVEDEKLEKVKEEEEHKEIEESTKEIPKKVKVTVTEEKLEKVKDEEKHKEIEESTKETPKKVKVTVEDEKLEKVKEEEEHKEIEESTKEMPKKVKVSVEEEKLEKVEKEEEDRKEIPKKAKVAVEEEKPKKLENEKVKESDFCPEGYAKFEESCLYLGTKAKVSARSGKLSSSSPMTNLVENIPVGDDNSCPPGTEHTERGVCQKLLTQGELKLKKVDQGCPENSRLVDGRCTFHSFEQMTSTMEMPLETSERMEVQPEIHHEEEYSTPAPEHKVIVESEFETTMQTVLKA